MRVALRSHVDHALKARLERCTSLPTLPSVALKVLDLCQRENLDLPEIAKVITNDPALAAKMLKTVNSPAFALRQEVRTLTHAVALLGVNSVRTLVLSFSLLRDIRKAQRAALTTYWKRSLLAGLCARELATSMKFPYREEAFLASLLQDIGILALRQLGDSVYNDLLENAGWDHDRLIAGEHAAFDCDHAEVGAWLVQRWRLPERFCLSVNFSHKPWRFDGDPKGDMTNMVRLTALAGPVADIWIRPDATGAAQRAHIEAAKIFRGMPFSLEETVKNIAAALPEISSLFEIDLGSAERTKEILAEAQEALVTASVEGPTPTRVATPAAPPPTPAGAKKKPTERDAVTDLANGASGFSYLEDQFAAALNSEEPLSVVVAEVDGWKTLSERLGEVGSAAMLRALAPCLSNRLRKRDLVARATGGEFMFVLPDTNADGAEVVAERSRGLVAALAHVADAASGEHVTISFGCATYTAGFCATAAELCGLADRALYAAKAAGGNRTATAEKTIGAVVRSNSAS
jgi:diguanylate cyclase (GGDEF)-like protein